MEPGLACRNCQQPLNGAYCSHCGQRERGGDLHFSEAAGDLLGDMFSWDSRVWRTLLPLLFRPGFLTAEFIAGRRARYVAPLRLYLIVSFILFLVISLGADSLINVSKESTDVPAEHTSIVGGEAPENARESVVDVAVPPHRDSPDEMIFAPITLGSGSATPQVTADDFTLSLADPNSPQWLRDLNQRLEVNGQKITQDPTIFAQRLVDYLPQMMFLMLPLFALLLWLCYLLSPFHYLQHLVFSLHYHSFAYLLYLLSLLLDQFKLELGGLLLPFLLGYLPIALWRCYGSGAWAAVGKSALIYFSYALLLIAGFVFASLVAITLL